MDPVSVSLSVLLVVVAVLTFFWQYLRQRDAFVCTLVACEVEGNAGRFQFSIANLGTRAALLRSVAVPVFMQSDLQGKFMDLTAILDLPKVIKAGEIVSVTAVSPWDEHFVEASFKKAMEQGPDTPAELFFEAHVLLSNPNGRRFVGRKLVATHTIDRDRKGSSFAPAIERSFRCTKVNERRRARA